VEQSGFGMGSALGALVLFLASLAIIAYVVFRAVRAVLRPYRTKPLPAAPVEARPQPLPKEQIEARLLWDWHEKQDVVHRAGLQGDVATIIVHEKAFLALDPAEQAGYAETLNMAALGPGRSMPEYLFIGYESDKPIARWTRDGVVLI
jgi:hypothetical protein